jgi:hypothetical protein
VIRAVPLTLAATALLAGCGHGKKSAPEAALVMSASATASADVSIDRVEPDEEYLLRASVTTLVPLQGPGVRPGAFEVSLDGPEGRRIARAEPAFSAAPTAYRAPLAFYRLARALGMRVVPVAVVHAISVTDLGAALDGQQGGLPILRELRVQNDGTVDVFLATRSSAAAGSPWEAPRGTPVEVHQGREVTTWHRWASAPSPAPGEDGALLRDYVEMRILDYLAANVARRTATRSGSALVLADNGTAFPPRPDGPTLDHMLRGLRAVARFPRGLRTALAGLDRARAAAAFAGGGFETWLLSPRSLVELDERRAALLTLVEARIAERGVGAVLTL